MNPRQLLNAIRLRAYAMVFASEGKVTFEAAKRAASKQIISEQRAKKRVSVQQVSSNNDVTVSSARKVMLARLAGIAQRLKLTAGLETESTPTPPQIRKHTLDPEGLGAGRKGPKSGPKRPDEEEPKPAPINKQSEPEQPPAEPVFIFGTTSTSERIPDSEYAPRFHDYVTDNWRRSIATNERIAREKAERSKWIG
jgi:hypothetical protein